MRKIVLLCIIIFGFLATTQAQQQLQEQMFYYSAKGISFIPPLTKPGLVYGGKLYLGKRKLSTLFHQLNDEQLNFFFKKYKANKTAADILSVTGTFAIPLANIIVAANDGKINWWLIGAGVLCSGTSGVLNLQAQKYLLKSAYYYDKKMGFTHAGISIQQQSIGFAIPLSK